MDKLFIKKQLMTITNEQMWAKCCGNACTVKCDVPFCKRGIDAKNFAYCSTSAEDEMNINKLITICKFCNYFVKKLGYNNYVESTKYNKNCTIDENNFVPDSNESNDYNVCFCGLPSSGKSSIINSLIGRRVLDSGICRTTTDKREFEEFVKDDAGNKFKVIDLPGICDSEEKNNNFTDLTEAFVIKSNLIFWVSDVNKAFLTTHEVDAYNKIKALLNKNSTETGTVYNIAIMLSKCDIDASEKCDNKKNTRSKNRKVADEICCDDEEDTSVKDIIKQVKSKFPNDTIMLLNAYGRSYYKTGSDNLKKFVSNMYNGGFPSTHNVDFSIGQFKNQYPQLQETMYETYFDKKYVLYQNNQYDIEKLYNIYARSDQQHRQKIFMKMIDDCTTYDQFVNVDYVYNMAKYNFAKKIYLTDSLDIFNICFDQINMFFMKYNLKNNSLDAFTTKIFENLSPMYKRMIMSVILHNNSLIVNEQHRFNFVIKYFDSCGGIEYFDTKKMFNKILKSDYIYIPPNHAEFNNFTSNARIALNVLYNMCLHYLNVLPIANAPIITPIDKVFSYVKEELCCSSNTCVCNTYKYSDKNCRNYRYENLYATRTVNNVTYRYVLPQHGSQLYDHLCTCGHTLQMKKIPGETKISTNMMAPLDMKHHVMDHLDKLKNITTNKYFILGSKIRLLFNCLNIDADIKDNISVHKFFMMLCGNGVFSNIMKNHATYKNINENFWCSVVSKQIYDRTYPTLYDWNIMYYAKQDLLVSPEELSYD